MEKFLASFLIAGFLLIGFIYAVRQSAIDNGPNILELRFDQNRRVDFKPTDKDMLSGEPFLVDGVITDEQADTLEIEFRYIVPPESRDVYWISFSPPSSDFQNIEVALKRGPNSMRLSTHFEPKMKFKRLYHGTRLNFYIYKRVLDTKEIQVFSRRVVFEKRWRKPRRVGFYELNPSQFHTK